MTDNRDLWEQEAEAEQTATEKLPPHARDFADLAHKHRPSIDGLIYLCPRCYGHGQWWQMNTWRKQWRLIPCGQCQGYGWVSEADATCVHEWAEIDQAQCRQGGITHHGPCYHVYKCKLCGRTHGADSSG